MARHIAHENPGRGRDPKVLALAGGGGIALLALLFFVVLPMLTGGSSTGSSAATSLPLPRVHGSGPSAKPSATPSSPAPTVIDPGDPGRDPFASLAGETTSTGSGSTTGGTSVTSAATASLTPLAPVSSSSSSPSTTTGGSPAGAAAAPTTAASTSSVTTVRLLAVVGSTARLEISGTEHSVKAGDKLQGFTIDKVDMDGVFLEYQGSSAALAPGESQNF